MKELNDKYTPAGGRLHRVPYLLQIVMRLQGAFIFNSSYFTITILSDTEIEMFVKSYYVSNSSF